MENLPITDFYKYTVPAGTQDCEQDPVYDRDQVFRQYTPTYIFDKPKINFEEFSALFHDGYFSRHGCNIPFYGGLRISNDNRRPLCINTTLYSRDMVDDMMRAVIQEMKIPCKKSEIYFGVPIVEVAENETRCS